MTIATRFQLERTLRPMFRRAIAAIGLAAVTLSLANCAGGAPNRTAPSGGPLKVAARIGLGRATSIALDQLADAEAPDGTFYFSTGSLVRVVRGSSAPVRFLTAARPVLALTATTTDLYVQTGLRISDYRVPGGDVRRSWSLPSQPFAPTAAGLFVEGNTLWSWSDGSTDQSGFEYATIDEVSIASSAIQVIDEHAYPDDVAADRSGIYYETEVGGQGHLAHVTPTGTRTLSRPTTDVDSPLAIASGSAVLFTEHGNGIPYLDRFSTTSLGLLSSDRERSQVLTGAGTSVGLLGIACNEADCANRSIVRIAPASGTVTGAITLAGLATLIEGGGPAALTDVNGRAYLVRVD